MRQFWRCLARSRKRSVDMSNPWFRMYSEFMHDPKVQIMSEQDQRRLVMVFCMRCNGDVTLQDCHVTFQLRISQSEWEQTKAVFVASGFMDSCNKILNWDKRQFVSDSSKSRVAKHRALHHPVTVTSCNVTVTPPEQNRTEQKQKNTRANRADIFPDITDRQLVEDWLVIRKTKKLPATVTAINGLRKEFEKAGLTPGQALRKCCVEGWGGFKANWLTAGKSTEPKKAWE